MGLEALRKVSSSVSHATTASAAGGSTAPPSTSGTTSAPTSVLSVSPVLTPRSSLSRDSAKDKDASTSRMAKMRAAMHIGSVYDDWVSISLFPAHLHYPSWLLSSFKPWL